MRNRLLIIAVFYTLICNVSFAQIVGTNCFLQGHWLEIGMMGNASFGPTTSPAGYHPHSPGTTVGSPLAEVYDYGHDGWTTGAPAFMGDYTYPGSPFEGWELQLNGGQAQFYEYYGTGIVGSATLAAGSGFTSYVNSGGRIIGNWAGSVSYGGQSLYLKQETRVDTQASWVVVTTKMYNTTSTTATGVYYLRTCDPDNDETWPGGSFTTNNVVNYQVPDAGNRVEVTATGNSATHPPLGLCTKDCRAVAFIYNAWALSSSVDLSTCWRKTYSPAQYTVGTADPGDIAIGLVFNVGSIGAGDSAMVSYAYVFDGVSGIDSAFPDPGIVINGNTVMAFPDTLDGCLLPGVDSVPIDLSLVDKTWTWSTWTWSPSTGLSASTGSTNYVHLNEISGNVTYTVSTNDSNVLNHTCNHTQLVFTIHSCHLATANTPCYGDTLHLGMLGDSLGATYTWYGPGGFVSVQHDPYRYPATWADTGSYLVVRTISGVTDSDRIDVKVHPLPPLTLSSNIPVCGTMQPTLNLTVVPDSIGETFVWSGPNGFSATSNAPSLPFDSSDAGTYIVNATTRYGCKSTSSINIWPGIAPGFTHSIHLGCTADTVIFTDTTHNADTYLWNFGDGVGSAATRNAEYIYSAHRDAVFTVSLSLSNAHCTATVSDTVDVRHEVHAIFRASPDTLCFGQAITFVDSSYYMHDGSVASAVPYGLANYVWHFGDGMIYTLDTAYSPIYTYAAPGMYGVQLVVTDPIGCVDSMKDTVYVIQVNVNGFSDTTLCISQPLALANNVSIIPDIYVTGWQYQWTPGANLDDSTAKVPNFDAIGSFTYTDLVTLNPWGCTGTYSTTVNSIIGKVLSNVTPSTTIPLGSSINLNADSEVIYYWKPNDGSLSNNNINDPVATPGETTTYTVYGYDVNGCLDSATVTISVDSTMEMGMPSGFTPGESTNNIFKPIGPMFAHMVEMRIFNRWGEEMFYSNNRSLGWDGKFHGVPQDVGTYYYEIIVAATDGTNKVYKGSLILIR
jgi:gliding motility-associated-like protein